MKKILTWLDVHGEAAVIGVLVAAMSVLMIIQVTLRYLFHTGINWVEEVVVYMHVWCGFIGLSYCVRHKSDMRIDISNILPPVVAKALRFISDAILLGFYIYMFKTGIGVMRQLISTGQKSAAAQIPMYYVYGALMVGCLLATLRFIQRIILWVIAVSKRKEK